jgi:hypothetical protein
MNAKQRRLQALAASVNARALDALPFVPYVTTFAAPSTEQEQALQDEGMRLIAERDAGRIRIGCVWRVVA